MLAEPTALTSGALAFAVGCGLPPRIPVAAMDRWLES